jgi:hypothetical protein
LGNRYNEPMSEAVRIIEVIGWPKVVFAAPVAIDISLIAWLAQDYRTGDSVVIVLALIAVVGTTISIVGVNRSAFRRIAELRNL